jgi:NAD(P)-dependent dehydrogenase (short-subunit alcohol dehydrogenase family)
MTDAESLVRLLEELADDPAELASIPAELRRALLIAAGRLSRPDRDAQRALRRAHRKNDRTRARAEDERRLSQTRIRTLRERPVFPTPSPFGELPAEAEEPPPLNEAKSCYVCKAEYRELHHHYDALCRACGDFNFHKRNDSVPLPGRVALITGARVKIGYHAAIKLLRAGAEVIATTRFPRDAAQRYEREPDYEEWRGRLHLVGIDLRHTPSVEKLCRELDGRFHRLDFILNNACQTVRRPPAFYQHLLAGDEAPVDSLFPVGQLDADLQQIDLRPQNSWRLRLHEVPTIELLEVHLVNAVAPFVLNAKLKPLMLRAPSADKHIVNVSAMEGQFYRAFKTDKHPHTNMAKAALNMLTRTSAADYVKDGIHMNSVDTGWITDEDPAPTSAKKAVEQGRAFSPPLDVVDGAARILAPIFEGFHTGRHNYGLFFKDYKPEPW